MKRGQGLPLNTIIIAIIVIVVLVVIILIFTGQLTNFGGSANACLQQGGFCADTCSSEGTVNDNGYCAQTDVAGNVCCKDYI